MSGTTVFRMSFSVAMMCLTRKFAASLMFRLSLRREKKLLEKVLYIHGSECRVYLKSSPLHVNSTMCATHCDLSYINAATEEV